MKTGFMNSCWGNNCTNHRPRPSSSCSFSSSSSSSSSYRNTNYCSYRHHGRIFFFLTKFFILVILILRTISMDVTFHQRNTIMGSSIEEKKKNNNNGMFVVAFQTIATTTTSLLTRRRNTLCYYPYRHLRSQTPVVSTDSMTATGYQSYRQKSSSWVRCKGTFLEDNDGNDKNRMNELDNIADAAIDDDVGNDAVDDIDDETYSSWSLSRLLQELQNCQIIFSPSSTREELENLLRLHKNKQKKESIWNKENSSLPSPSPDLEEREQHAEGTDHGTAIPRSNSNNGMPRVDVNDEQYYEDMIINNNDDGDRFDDGYYNSFPCRPRPRPRGDDGVGASGIAPTRDSRRDVPPPSRRRRRNIYVEEGSAWTDDLTPSSRQDERQRRTSPSSSAAATTTSSRTRRGRIMTDEARRQARRQRRRKMQEEGSLWSDTKTQQLKSITNRATNIAKRRTQQAWEFITSSDEWDDDDDEYTPPKRNKRSRDYEMRSNIGFDYYDDDRREGTGDYYSRQRQDQSPTPPKNPRSTQQRQRPRRTSTEKMDENWRQSKRRGRSGPPYDEPEPKSLTTRTEAARRVTNRERRRDQTRVEPHSVDYPSSTAYSSVSDRTTQNDRQPTDDRQRVKAVQSPSSSSRATTHRTDDSPLDATTTTTTTTTTGTTDKQVTEKMDLTTVIVKLAKYGISYPPTSTREDLEQLLFNVEQEQEQKRQEQKQERQRQMYKRQEQQRQEAYADGNDNKVRDRRGINDSDKDEDSGTTEATDTAASVSGDRTKGGRTNDDSDNGNKDEEMDISAAFLYSPSSSMFGSSGGNDAEANYRSEQKQDIPSRTYDDGTDDSMDVTSLAADEQVGLEDDEQPTDRKDISSEFLYDVKREDSSSGTKRTWKQVFKKASKVASSSIPKGKERISNWSKRTSKAVRQQASDIVDKAANTIAATAGGKGDDKEEGKEMKVVDAVVIDSSTSSSVDEKRKDVPKSNDEDDNDGGVVIEADDIFTQEEWNERRRQQQEKLKARQRQRAKRAAAREQAYSSGKTTAEQAGGSRRRTASHDQQQQQQQQQRRRTRPPSPSPSSPSPYPPRQPDNGSRRSDGGNGWQQQRSPRPSRPFNGSNFKPRSTPPVSEPFSPPKEKEVKDESLHIVRSTGSDGNIPRTDDNDNKDIKEDEDAEKSPQGRKRRKRPTKDSNRSGGRNERRRNYSPWGEQYDSEDEPSSSLYRDSLDEFGNLVGNTVEAFIFGVDDADLHHGRTQDVPDQRRNGRRNGTSRDQTTRHRSNDRRRNGKHWKDRMEEQLDSLLGIHENGKFYDRWITEEIRDELAAGGTDALSYAQGRAPKKRGTRIRDRPVWEEENSLLGILFGTGQPKGSRRRASKRLTSSLLKSGSILLLFRTIIQSLSIVGGIVGRWASVRGAIPQPVVVVGIVSAALASRPNRRLRNIILAVLILRAAGELVHGFIFDDDDLSWIGDSDEDLRDRPYGTTKPSTSSSSSSPPSEPWDGDGL